MKSKRMSFLPGLGIVGTAAVIGLMALAMIAREKGYQNLKMVMPHEYSTPNYNLKKIEEISAKDLLISYEIKKKTTAENAGSRQTVTLIGTNKSYQKIFGLPVTAGQFITDEAWHMGSRHAVLSETAAFRIFGGNDILGNTFWMEGELWLVAGICRDENTDQAYVYVPSRLVSGAPQTLMIQSEKGKADILNSLHQLGIYDSNSLIIDLHAVSQSFAQGLYVSVCTAICLGMLLLLLRAWQNFTNSCKKLQLLYRNCYLAELIKKNRRQFLGLLLWFLAGILSLLVFFKTAERILVMVLRGQEVFTDFQYLAKHYGHERTQWLVATFYGGAGLSLALVAILFLSAFIYCLAAAKNGRYRFK